ncbi:DUF5610 domain-containing protein [Colwelliaceae bacterium 6471]
MANINQLIRTGPLFNHGRNNASEQHQLNPSVTKPMQPLTQTIDSHFSPSSKSAVSTNLLYRAVAQQFSASTLYDENQLKTDEVANDSLFDFEKVADNVLAFIGSSIMAAKSRGLADDELEGMFEQARAGVEKGIGEAKEQLSDMNMLDDEIDEGIEKSRALINDGIDKLHQNVFPPQSQDPTSIVDDFELPDAASYQVKSSTDIYNANSQTSDLSITTADGDIVNISFSHLQESLSSSRRSFSSGEGFQQASIQSSAYSYEELNFSFSIEGELDDEEKAAIGSLIKDINKLQKEFFDGDINKAFEQALELGFDESQLSSFTLDLQKTSTSIVSQAYQEVATLGDEHARGLSRFVKPLFDFAQQFEQLQKSSEQILAPELDQLDKLMESVYNAQFANQEDKANGFGQFNQFINKLK